MNKIKNIDTFMAHQNEKKSVSACSNRFHDLYDNAEIIQKKKQ